MTASSRPPFIRYSLEELQARSAMGYSQTDWQRVAAADASLPTDDLPDDFWDEAVCVHSPNDNGVRVPIEKNVFGWYQQQAKKQPHQDYQALINSVLLAYINQQQEAAKKPL